MKWTSDPKRRTALAATWVVALILALWGWRAWEERQQWLRLVSCHNHGNRLRMQLMPDAPSRSAWHPPYLAGTEGYMMLASCSKPLGGRLQCHHGAYGREGGGWQAVNLPPEKWEELFSRWPKQGAWDGVPFYWCGRPGLKQQRLLAVVQKHGYPVWIDKVSESHLTQQVERLNQLLTAMGEHPVSLNIPDKVDWDKAPLWPAAASSNSVQAATER